MVTLSNSQNIFTLLKQRQYGRPVSNDSLLELRIKHNMQNRHVPIRQFIQAETGPRGGRILTVDVNGHFIAIGTHASPSEPLIRDNLSGILSPLPRSHGGVVVVNGDYSVELWDIRTNQRKWTWKAPPDQPIHLVKIILDKTITLRERTGSVVCAGGEEFAALYPSAPAPYITVIDLQEGTPKTTINPPALESCVTAVVNNKIVSRLYQRTPQVDLVLGFGAMPMKADVLQWDLAGKPIRKLPNCYWVTNQLDSHLRSSRRNPWLVYFTEDKTRLVCYNTETDCLRELPTQRDKEGTKDCFYVNSFYRHQNMLILAYSNPKRSSPPDSPLITCEVIDLELPDLRSRTYTLPTEMRMDAPFVVANHKWICLLLETESAHDSSTLTIQAIHQLTKKYITLYAETFTRFASWDNSRLTILHESILMLSYKRIVTKFWDLHSGKELCHLSSSNPESRINQIVYVAGKAFAIRGDTVLCLDFLFHPLLKDPSITQALTKKRPRDGGS